MTTAVIIGLPTEAGTHFPGQSLAPRALLNAGLPEAIAKAGLSVGKTIPDLFSGPGVDDETRAAAKWAPAEKMGGVRNVEKEARVLSAIRQQLDELHEKEALLDTTRHMPIFIGGDCTISMPILSALHAAAAAKGPSEGGGNEVNRPKIGLIYFDGDADLNLPAQAAAETDSTGVLDSFTMTHLTQRKGGLPSMQGAGQSFNVSPSPSSSSGSGQPLVTPQNTVFFGLDPLQPQPDHWAYLLERGFKALTRPMVRRDPVAAAREALRWLRDEAAVDWAVLHFDVDVIDSGKFPLGNYPSYAGLEAEEAFAALKVFLASDLVRVLTVTEVNPNNDPDGWMVRQVVEGIGGRTCSKGEKGPVKR